MFLLIFKKDKIIYKKFKLLSGQKFAKDSLATLFSQAILAISGLVLNLIIGNYYSAAGLGVFSQAFSYFLLISIVVNIGIPNSLVKHSAEYIGNDERLKVVLSGSITLNIIISLFSLILLLPFLHFFGHYIFNPELNKALFAIVIAVPIYALNKNYIGFLNGTRRMFEYSFYQALRWLLLLTVILVFIYFDSKIYNVLYSFIISELILFAILSIKLSPYLYFSIHNEFYKKHLNYGTKTVMAFVVDEISKSSSIIMIGFFLGNQSAGIYSFAVTIAQGILMLPAVIGINFNPIISNLTSTGSIDQLRIYMTKIKKILFKFMIPVNILALLAFPIVVEYFMKGDEYSASYLPYYIMMIGVISISFFTWAGGMLSMAGLLKENLIRVSISMSANIIFNIILIPTLKVEGAAIALTLNYLFQLFLLYYFMKKKMNLKLF